VVSRGVLAMGGGRWIDRPMLPMRNRRDNENQARSFTLLSLRSHQLRTFHHSHEFQYYGAVFRELLRNIEWQQVSGAALNDDAGGTWVAMEVADVGSVAASHADDNPTDHGDASGGLAEGRLEAREGDDAATANPTGDSVGRSTARAGAGSVQRVHVCTATKLVDAGRVHVEVNGRAVSVLLVDGAVHCIDTHCYHGGGMGTQMDSALLPYWTLSTVVHAILHALVR
jgi:hypothetical protein